MKRINTINKKIMSIINIGVQRIYAKTEKGLKRVIIYNGSDSEQRVVESISSLFRDTINKKFTDFKEEPLCEDSLVIEKDKYFYTKLDDKYNPFKSLSNLPGKNDILEESEMKYVQGFFFEYNKNSLEKVFIYQILYHRNRLITYKQA